MEIVLYTYSGEKSRVDKTNYLLISETLTGNIREQSSLINPVITIELNNDLVNGFNYVKITEFGRYYFVVDKTFIVNRIWQISLACDVLYTYKTQITALNALVERNENDYNVKIDDKYINYEYIKEVTKANWTTTTEFNFTSTTANSFNIILTTISTDNRTGSNVSVDYSLPAVLSYEVGAVGTKTAYYALNAYSAQTVMNAILNNDTLRGFIKSMVVLPFQPDDILTGTETSITIGTHEITIPINTRRLSYQNYNRIKYATITTPNANNFNDLEPYTKYEIYIPFKGFIPFNLNQNQNSTIVLYYNIDYENAQANYLLYNRTKEFVIDSGTCTMGVRLGLNSTNALEIQNQKTSMAINATLGGVSSAIAIAGGVATGNPVAVAGGVLSLARNAGNTFSQAVQMYEQGRTEQNGSIMGLMSPREIYIRKTRMKPVDTTNYESVYGKPLNEFRILNTLTGFTKISEIHLENFVSATKNELQEIESLLKEGVIL